MVTVNTTHLPTLLELVYDGNYVGRFPLVTDIRAEVYTLNGQAYVIIPRSEAVLTVDTNLSFVIFDNKRYTH